MIGQTQWVDATSEIEELAALSPVERAMRAEEMIEEHRARIRALAAVRAGAVSEVVTAEGGATAAGRRLGLSRGRIYQLLNARG